ncbi:hypothetical protein PR001_g17127 [Phytophthora rubi]|uniref:Uncharacterized protein n=1 Tax=Phytophthora rubi TaxID=129364 RepID=A0A6A3KLQ8_9STRA|nr:hypothetical protein PR001_g17127 [Phytophthora rubi]
MIIKNEWDAYYRSSSEKELPSESLQCTFVMEPMCADFSDVLLTSEVALVMETLVRNNVWFSEICTLSAELDEKLGADAREAKKAVGQLVASVFDSTRRNPEEACTKYYPEIDTFEAELNPLQLGTVNMDCNFAVRDCDVLAMCSAIAVSRTTKTLRMQLSLEQEDDDYNIIYRGHLWKYLAYGLFSARSRELSALESIELFCIDSMSLADIETFCAILASRHPEEDMLDFFLGHGNERDATLMKNTPIRWQFDSGGQVATDSSPIILDSPVHFVRSFNDDGKSDWVDAILPGYGRCQVQRKNLKFDPDEGGRTKGTVLTSLCLRFTKYRPSVSTGLPQFLGAVGSSLSLYMHATK